MGADDAHVTRAGFHVRKRPSLWSRRVVIRVAKHPHHAAIRHACARALKSHHVRQSRADASHQTKGRAAHLARSPAHSHAFRAIPSPDNTPVSGTTIATTKGWDEDWVGTGGDAPQRSRERLVEEKPSSQCEIKRVARPLIRGGVRSCCCCCCCCSRKLKASQHKYTRVTLQPT